MTLEQLKKQITDRLTDDQSERARAVRAGYRDLLDAHAHLAGVAVRAYLNLKERDHEDPAERI